ncbi:hypothetical protein [Persicobacter psychrovividus]|uniref:DUF5017 domain-containing protein n=1 Tax=Persicobacter psychrovividus TaxID=387638 RepID=A0ABN6LF78_9BACT|nr:hypothetical protein PEPS_24020 [Persicobacter psychrovividus]
MKSYNFIFGLILLMAMACDPLSGMRDDLADHADLKAQRELFQSSRELAMEEYILTPADYQLSSVHTIGAQGSFTVEYPATEYLPEILTKKFYGEEMQVVVAHFNQKQPLENAKELEENSYYVLTDEDYDNLGLGYKTVSAGQEDKYLPVLLKNMYPYAVEGMSSILQYKVYQMAKPQLATWVKGTDGTWTQKGEDATFGEGTMENGNDAYVLTDQDYVSMGTEKDQPGENYYFSRFVSTEDFIPAFLASSSIANGKSEITINFKFYGTQKEMIQYQVEDGMWVAQAYYGDWDFEKGVWKGLELTAFGNYLFSENKQDYSKSTWITDPFTVVKLDVEDGNEPESAILYELVEEDYKLNGERYPNFDMRNNTEETINAKIEAILKARFFGDFEDGMIYKVKYDIYDGGAIPQTAFMQVNEI